MFWSCHLSLCLSVFMSVYRLLPSFCYRPFYTCLVCLPPCLLSFCQALVCLSVILSILLLFCLPLAVCRLLCLSFTFSLTYHACRFPAYTSISRSISLICPIFLLQSLLPVLSVAVLLICTSACRLDHLCFSYAACLFVCHPFHPLKLLVTFFQNELRLAEKISYGH